MLTAKMNDASSNSYERYYAVTGINEETISYAKNIFEEYRLKGVILNGNFSDDEWLLTNQLTKMSLKFCPNEFSFRKFTGKWIGCSYRCFVDGVKAYAAFHMGRINLAGIKEIVRKIMCIAEKSRYDLPAETHLLELLKLLPGNETKDQVIEDMEERILFGRKKQINRRQRILADFGAYFKFNDVLEEFWAGSNTCEKLFYFPLYFWWTLTAILPLRPTEFLLTPRQCIEKKNGENILTVRRTMLKDGKRKLCYSIDGDYRLMKYSVPDKMAAEIKKYLEATAGMTVSSLNTLFVKQPYYSYLLNTAPSFSYYYTYTNLSYCLKRFQNDVMKIESDDNRINLGDTRHLAMISLIASGGSPVVCRELAGHEDINISAHYYSNISRFVECATYEIYRKQKGNSAEIIRHNPFCAGETVDVNGGRCDSAAYISGSISDCICNIGTGGELGRCIYCPHFIDGKSGRYLLFSDTDERKKQVDDDSKYLMRVLETARKGKGCNEDIQAALLRLQYSSSQYSECIYKNMGGIL